MGLDGEKTRRINTLRPHLFTRSSATWETRAAPWARASARPQSGRWEGISVRLSPRAEDLCQPQLSLWHPDPIRLSDHSYHPSPCARRAPLLSGALCRLACQG